MQSITAQNCHKSGRPVFDRNDQVRDKLLAAATELFANYEFRAVSIRQIAGKAGVNTAMVHYYFGDKRGLYMAMMEKVSLPIEKALRNIAKRDDLSITEFISIYTDLLLDNPWYPIFITREGIIGEGSIRDAASERLTSASTPAMLNALENDRKNGRIRNDLDLRLVALTVASLITFPFLMRPLVEKSLKFTFDKENVKRMVAHTTDIFLHGISNYKDAHQ